MNILRLLFKIKNVKIINFYEKVLGCFSRKLTDEEVKEFIKLYLNLNYTKEKYGFAIIDYLNAAYDREVFSDEELDELLLNSRYFKTLPDELVCKFMKKFGFCSVIQGSMVPRFISFMTSRVVDVKELIDLINSTSIVDFSTAKQMLINQRDINVLIEAERKVGFVADKLALGEDIIKSGLYSFADFIKYCEYVNPSIDYLIEWLREYYNLTEDKRLKNQILDKLLRFAVSEDVFPNPDNRIINLKHHKKIEGYDYYTYEIERNGKFSEEMKTALIKKITRSHDKRLMWAWLSYVKAQDNKIMIDRLLECSSDTIVLTLSCLKSEDFEYALKTLIERNGRKIDLVLAKLEEYIDSFTTEKIDEVITILINIKPDYQVSRQLAIELIKMHSRYTLALFRMFDFTTEEREAIYETYKSQGAEDSCAIYGAYLLSGKREKLLNAEDNENGVKSLEQMRERKKR